MQDAVPPTGTAKREMSRTVEESEHRFSAASFCTPDTSTCPAKWVYRRGPLRRYNFALKINDLFMSQGRRARENAEQTSRSALHKTAHWLQGDAEG